MSLQSLQKKIKFAGLRATLKESLFTGVNKLFYFECLHALNLESDGISEKYLNQSIGDLTIGSLSPEQAREFSKNPAYDLPPDFVEESIVNGDTCIAITDGDILASYTWYSSKPTRVTGEFSLNLSDSWVYAHRGFTNPDYRGRRLHAIGTTFAAQYFKDRGLAGVTTIVSHVNAASLKSCERMGFVPSGKIFLASRFNHYVAYHDAKAKTSQVWVSPRRQGPKFHFFNRPRLSQALSPDMA